MTKRVIVLCAALAYIAQPAAAESALNIAVNNVGLSLGNSRNFTGLRINFVDRGVENINGVNLTLWKPDENPRAVFNGLSLALVGASGRELNGLIICGVGLGSESIDGIGIGGIGIGAEQIRGLAVGGIGIGVEDMSGIGVGGIGIGGETLHGVFVGGIGVGGEELKGIFSGIVGVGGEDLTGLFVTGLGVGGGELHGVVASAAYSRFDYAKGWTTGGYNRVYGDMIGLQIGLLNMADYLNGVQIGLINYVGNNPVPFKILPILNVHIDR